MRFSGHESFHCRHFWLKKGYDYLKNDGNFNDPSSTSILGVGKNMVTSINFWLKAFAIVNDKDSSINHIADYLFSNDGKDPYLEDIGTLWLLQYHLVNNEYASIYSLIFKEFRKRHLNSQFTPIQLQKDIERLLKRDNSNFSERTVQTDVRVFLRSYFVDSKNKRDIEDDLASILVELNLIDKISGVTSEEGDLYRINLNEKEEIPTAIFLYAILDAFDINPDSDYSISFDEIQQKVADLWACNREGLEKHIEQIQEKFRGIVYKEDAGRKEIQIKAGNVNKWEVLNQYYE